MERIKRVFYTGLALIAATFASSQNAYARDFEKLLKYINATPDTSLAFRDRIVKESITPNGDSTNVEFTALRVYEGGKGYEDALQQRFSLEGRLRVKVVRSENWPSETRFRHLEGGLNGHSVETFTYDREGNPWGFREYMAGKKDSPEEVLFSTRGLEPEDEKVGLVEKGIWVKFKDLSIRTQKRALDIYKAAIKNGEKEATSYFTPIAAERKRGKKSKIKLPDPLSF